MTATRRHVFGLIAAPSVIALPSTAAALAAGHPDAALLDLERQRVIALADYERLSERADEILEHAVSMHPPKPEALRAQPSDWFTVHVTQVGDYMDYATVSRWREAVAADARDPRHFDLIPKQRERMLARAREIVAAADAHRASCEAVYVATGARRASQAAEAACLVLGDIEDRILTTPARTPEGLAIKARMVAYVMGDEPDGTREDFATRCLLADLVAVREA